MERRSARDQGTSPRTDIRLRTAEARDLDQLIDLEDLVFAGDPHRLSRRQWRHLVLHATGETAVAEAGEGLCGVIVLVHRSGGRTLRIYSLAVHPERRGRGVAGRLLDHAVELAARRGLDRLRLEVREENTPALRLYASRGFRAVCRLPSYYGLGENALRMELELAD